MSRERLIKRLKWYYPTEKFHAYFFFPFLLAYNIIVNDIEDVIFLAYGLLLCIYILYQGQLYWKLKLSILMGENPNQAKQLMVFKKAKKENILFIKVIPLFLILQLILQDWNLTVNKMLYWGFLANMLAVLEHINYYHTQLMYDNKYDIDYLVRIKKLKKASLAKDLTEGRF